MASKNEKRAAELGISLKEYKASSEYKNKKTDKEKKDAKKDKKDAKKDKKDAKKAKKKAEEKIHAYYDTKTGQIKQKAATETARLRNDIQRILKDSGVAKNRAIEDYLRNIGNLEANKSADLEDLNYYVSTSRERLGEDLETSLKKESRRFGLESERINQELAEAGLTFSERRPEQIAREGSAQNITDIQTEANRSFQDIARFEAAKNRDLELKYGSLTEEAEVGKTRSLEDILNAQQEATLRAQRGVKDVAFGKSVDISDISYSRDTDIATTGMMFEQQHATEKLYKELKD